ncbi:MAG: MFS transporter [Anaerolineales bacterium]
MKIINRQRWIAVAIFFLFMLLHQTDRLLIGPLTSSIMAEFNLSEVQMGGIITGSLILGSIFYPIWGFLYDRFTRPKLLALASLLWGITTWLSAIAPTARLFLISRASTGIDDSSYPGIASLISDYFSPQKRSRIFGFLQLSIPLGYLLGLLLALNFGQTIGWRMIYILTGMFGLILSALIYFGVKDIPRGSSEPELTSLPEIKLARFDLAQLLGLIKIPTLRYLFLQGFIGVLPWQVITFWSFRYLEVERNYTSQTISSIMIPAVLLIGVGYFAGGFLGDAAYSKYSRGRLYVSIIGVLFGALFLTITLNIPKENVDLFRILLGITCVFIPLASPNIASTVYDVVLPEIRSTATSIQYFLGNLGSAFAPLIAGAIGQKYSLEAALLSISLIAWLLTAAILVVSAFYLPGDMDKMHQALRLRASGPEHLS